MSPTHSIKLNRTGDHIPLIGFGTARIAANDTEDVIYNAIKTGYRLIDAALCYKNEAEVGKGIRRAIADGIVKREDLFIVSKLWNHFHAKNNVRPAFDVTLENFGLEYIDLYLVHFPFATAAVDPRSNWAQFKDDKTEFKLERSPMHETWKEMEKLVDAGVVRNIGVSNFNVQSLLDLLTYARITPAILEIELHPYLQQRRLVKWVKDQDIQIIAYASFGNAVYENVPEKTAHLENLLKHPVVTKIAEKHDRDAGQVLLRFSSQENIVVIPKSVNVPRMKTNLDHLCFDLDGQDYKELNELEANARFNDFFPNNYGIDFPLFD